MTQDKKALVSANNLNLILVVLIVVFAIAAGYFYGRTSNVDNVGSKVATKTQEKSQDPLERPADNPKFLQCLDEGKFTDKVKAQAEVAAKAGLTGTPASVVFDLKTNKHLVVVGALPFDKFKGLLSDFMAGKKIASSQSVNPQDVDANSIPAPSVDADHWLGSPQARYVLVEYSDFECPYCKNFHSTPKRLVESEYPQKLAWVYRHMPLTSIHPQAQIEAEASECAADLGGKDKFWQYADSLFLNSKSNGRSFDKNSLANLASQLGIK